VQRGGSCERALDVRVGGEVPGERVAAEAQSKDDGGRQRRDLRQARKQADSVGDRAGNRGRRGGGMAPLYVLLPAIVVRAWSSKLDL